MPKAEASRSYTGLAAMVTSAPDFWCVLEHRPKVHPVELIAGQNHDVVGVGLGQITQILAHRVGGALIPVGSLRHGLLGRQDFDEAAAEIVEAIRAANMPVQADREELRQHVDPIQLAVDAVRERNVDQAGTCPPAGRPASIDTWSGASVAIPDHRLIRLQRHFSWKRSAVNDK